MVDWASSIFSGLGGAILALIGKLVIDWRNNPRLTIDFERDQNGNIVTQDYNSMIMGKEASTSRYLFLHLLVANKGKNTAYDCDAKMELIATWPRFNVYSDIIHWSKRAPKIYKTPDQLFSPINLNPNDKETVDAIIVEDVDGHHPLPYMQTYSEKLQLHSNHDFFVKVTIYARNATSKPLMFRVNWDGTVAGFNKAFTQVKELTEIVPAEPIEPQVM